MSQALITPINAVLGFPFQPLVNGPLLLLLLKGPEEVRTAFLNAVTQSKLATDPAVVLETTIKVLKWLFALGMVGQVGGWLDRLSMNNWGLTKRGTPWNFKNGQEIILITGGCSGFGLLMAKQFAGKGKIVVWDISEMNPELKSIPNLHFYKCDMTKSDQIAKTAAKVKAEVGNPSVLINNAGIAKANNIIDAKPEWTEAIFRVNLISHWQTVGEFLPAMLKAKKGHIVEMASASSFLGIPSMVDYCATKVGTLAFYEGLTQECRHLYPNGDTIQISVIHPTWAKTNIIADYEGDLKKAGQIVLNPRVVTDAVVEQVLKARSGQLIIPKEIAVVSKLRAAPIWIQETLRNILGKKMQMTRG